MKTITLRKIPEALAEVLEKRAEEDRTSLAQTAIKLMEIGADPDAAGSSETEHHDLDFLLGAWSEEEADEFDRALTGQRAIDPELWG